MNELDTRIRELVDTAAEPITFEEVAGRIPSRPARRVPLVAAVGCVAVVVAVAIGVAELGGGSTNGPTKIQVETGPPSSDSQPPGSTRTYNVPSASMTPTVEPGDRVMVDTVAFSRRDPTRFEVVWIKLPRQLAADPQTAPEMLEGLLKRIVGLPGETIEGRDGNIYIDGAILDESGDLAAGVRSETFGPVQIPAGSYFVLGDNRHYSNDSTNFGPVARSELIGPATELP